MTLHQIADILEKIIRAEVAAFLIFLGIYMAFTRWFFRPNDKNNDNE